MTTTMSELFLPLRAQLSGSLVVGNDGYWDVARAAWVPSERPRPSAVVRGAPARGGAAPVRVAAEHGLRVVRARSDLSTPPPGCRAGTILLMVSQTADALLRDCCATATVGTWTGGV
jgi:hypothetical protein